MGSSYWGDVAEELGFGFVERDNVFVSRKYNDGIQLACDPSVNPRPADYVVPIGSDDWVDYRILLDLPAQDTIAAFRNIAFVRPDGREMTARKLDNPGGAGIRVYPRQVVEMCGYRPADEDRSRGCDTSMLVNLRGSGSFRIDYRDTDPRQIVDWKSTTTQLWDYESVVARPKERWDDPFSALAPFYQSEALAEMRARF